MIDYRLQVSYDGAEPYTVADAYRFLPTLGEVDLHLFAEGRHERLWEVLGAHRRSFTTADGVVNGVSFAVWAPNATAVSVIGDWNHWNGTANPLAPRTDGSGIWEGTVAEARHGQPYKYRIVAQSGAVLEKVEVRGEAGQRGAQFVRYVGDELALRGDRLVPRHR